MKKLLVVLMFLGLNAFAGDPNVYLSAEFDHQDYYPKSNMIFDIFPLSPGVEGDLLSGDGNMETGSASGGCTYCPTGFTCTCTADSTNDAETAKLYKNNASLKNHVGVAGSANLYLTIDLAANTAYQLSWKHKGDVGGTEDFTIGLTQGGQSYNFSTDTWGAASSAAFNNVSSSWVTGNLYITVGAAPRAGALFNIAGSSASQTVYFDDMQIHKLKSTGPTSKVGPYTMNPAVTSDPVFGSNPNGQMRFADGPAMRTGTSFDGVDDTIFYAHTSAHAFDPCTAGKECQFTAACRGISNTVAAASGTAIGQSLSPDVWALYRYEDDLYFDINNGAASSGYPNGAMGCFTVGAQSNFVGTYRGVADNTSVMTISCNGIAPTTIANAHYPIQDAGRDLRIGATNSIPNYFWNGSIYHCSLYNKALDAIDASKWINPYFPGNNYNRGSYVTTCSQVASHATCSYDNCRDGTPSGCQAEGTGSMAIFGQGTELIPYNSFETVTGDDSAPAFTGWTRTLPGSAKLTAYRSDTKHGSVAARFKTTVASTEPLLVSSCITVSPSTAYYLEWWRKILGDGAAGSLFIIVTYSDGACANYVNQVEHTTYLQGVNGVGFSTGVGVNSAKISIYGSYPTISDVIIDAVSLKAGSYRTPWVHNPGAGSITYNSRSYTIRNTLADPIHSTGAYPFSTGFCTSAWIWTDANAGDHGFLEVPGTAGSNNRWFFTQNVAGTELDFAVFDSAGAYRYKYLGGVNDTNFTPGTWRYIEACSSNTGTLIARHYNTNNATWYNWPTADNVGTGIQTGQSTSLYIGNAFANDLNGYVSKVCIKPYNAGYTNCGFNSGRPPMNGQRPY